MSNEHQKLQQERGRLDKQLSLEKIILEKWPTELGIELSELEGLTKFLGELKDNLIQIKKNQIISLNEYKNINRDIESVKKNILKHKQDTKKREQRIKEATENIRAIKDRLSYIDSILQSCGKLIELKIGKQSIK